MSPTADDVAVAIVAACRETGDDPIKCATGGEGSKTTRHRGRHYAYHALLHVFPKCGRAAAARMVGCPPGRADLFWNDSWNQIVKPMRSGKEHMAQWFTDEAYDRVIRAIEAARTKRAITTARRRETPQEAADRAQRLLGNDRPRFDGLGRREYVPPTDSKAGLQQMLAEAAANTAKLQPKG